MIELFTKINRTKPVTVIVWKHILEGTIHEIDETARILELDIDEDRVFIRLDEISAVMQAVQDLQSGSS